MPRKVFCACGQALAVPDNYPKPVARCSACGGTVPIPGAPQQPLPTAEAVDSPYGTSAKPMSYGEPTYGQAPRQVSNDSRVLWVILGLIGTATALFCGCGGILYFAFSSAGDNQHAARPQPVAPVPQPNFPQPNVPPPSFPTPPAVSPTTSHLVWRRQTSNPGWFECDLPGRARTQTAVIDGVNEHKVFTDSSGGEFSVRYCQADELLANESRPTAIDAMYRRVWRREHTDGRSRDPSGIGAEGQELITGDGNRQYRGKFREHHGRVYELSWSGSPSSFDFSSWTRFTNSFQFRADLATPTPPRPLTPPPVVAPIIPLPTVPTTPATPAASAPNDFTKRRIYIPIKFKRRTIESLRKSMANFKSNARLMEATQKNIDRMTEDVDREIDSAARMNNLTRAQVEEIIREGEEKNW